MIKEYFANYYLHGSNVTFDLGKRDIEIHQAGEEKWRVTCVETGEATMTGGRIKRLAPHMGNETFMLTWGDGVSDINLEKLLDYHRSHGKLVTLTAVRPPARFGALEIRDGRIERFAEKPQIGEGWINGAFFVCEPGVFEYIDGDSTLFEREPLETLAAEGQLMAYQHDRRGSWRRRRHPRRCRRRRSAARGPG